MRWSFSVVCHRRCWADGEHFHKKRRKKHFSSHILMSETEREPNKSQLRHPKIEPRRIKTFNGWPRPRRWMEERTKKRAANSSCANAVKFPWEKFERLRLKPLSKWTNWGDEQKKTVSQVWCDDELGADRITTSRHKTNKMYDRSV